MRILVLNWRDVENPAGGGAEVFTHEVLTRLVDRGHDVTLFAAGFDGGASEEILDGVRIVRRGNRFTVYRRARRRYRRVFQGGFDVVVDEVNTRPFMAPSFVEDAPVVALIHQLAREFWFYEVPFPLDRLGYHWLEERWLSRYTDVPTLTVSDSTRSDLEALGFRDLRLVPEGISVEPLDAVPEKPERPTVLFVGRLTETKRPGHAIEAFERIQAHRPSARMHVVGDGYLREDLEARAGDLDVTFHGYVPEERKLELMRESHVLLVPGVREGWGLVVTEANAMGTPAVGYDVPGLRDSINDGETGLRCAPDPDAMARRACGLLGNGVEEKARHALADASRYSWDRTADAVESALQEVVA